MTAKVYCDLPFFRATASKHEVLPTLKVLRVRLKHRLFLFPKNLLLCKIFSGALILTVISSAVEKSRYIKYGTTNNEIRSTSVGMTKNK